MFNLNYESGLICAARNRRNYAARSSITHAAPTIQQKKAAAQQKLQRSGPYGRGKREKKEKQEESLPF